LFDLKPVDDIQIGVLPIKVFHEVRQADELRTHCDPVHGIWWRRKIEVKLLANPVDFVAPPYIQPVLIIGLSHYLSNTLQQIKKASVNFP
jgi:hypothetical protein